MNSEQVIIDQWTFGGGTAMMLQIDHRESYDIDIFLSDPQLLSFLDPQKRDFQFEIKPSAYRGDGVGSLRLVFDGVGQIDFIVARADCFTDDSSQHRRRNCPIGKHPRNSD